MNWIPLDGIAPDGRVLLTGPAHRHLVQVLKARVGDSVRVLAPDHGRGDAVVEAIDTHAATLRVGSLGPGPAPTGVHLLLALPPPKGPPAALRPTRLAGGRANPAHQCLEG